VVAAVAFGLSSLLFFYSVALITMIRVLVYSL